MSPRTWVAGMPAIALFQSAPLCEPEPAGLTAWHAASADEVARQERRKTSMTLSRHCFWADTVSLSLHHTMIDSPVQQACRGKVCGPFAGSRSGEGHRVMVWRCRTGA